MITTAFAAPEGRAAPAGILLELLLSVLALVPLAAARGQTTPAATQGGDTSGHFTLTILDPRGESNSTTRDVAHILGRTSANAQATVGGESARVFSTGMLVRDNVPLQIGENRIAVVATLPDGQRIERIVTIKRVAETPPPPEPTERKLEIDARSIEPAQNLVLSRGDIFQASFRGTPGQKAEFALADGKWQPMGEALDDVSRKPTGLYRASIVVTPTADADGSPVRFRLTAKAPATNSVKIIGENSIEASSDAKVGFWGESSLRLVRVKDNDTSLSFGIHEVRLGGPYLATLPAGTLLRVTGMVGGNYHVRLCDRLDAWVEARAVDWAPEATPLPHLAFTDLSAIGNETVDTVSIPYSSPAPFAVTPTTTTAGRAAIEIDLFGAHNAATWISHRPTAKVVREVSIQQISTDHVRLSVELRTKQLWGYQCTVDKRSVVLSVRRPPTLAPAPDSPLKGLAIALEAGHGGDNLGARGISGTLEKDVNRMAVEELSRQFEAAGAKVLIMRKDDESISLPDRVKRGIDANADVWISVHANSAGHTRGYLSVSGTSTYYKWSFCRDFADAIHSRLLEITHLPDFGNVGNFNYYPLRGNTWMPTMLVEQAFMSNPDDEARMLDPAFRSQMMRAVLMGTQDWLGQLRDDPRAF